MHTSEFDERVIKAGSHIAVGISLVGRPIPLLQWALARWENEGGAVQDGLALVPEMRFAPSLNGSGYPRAELA